MKYDVKNEHGQLTFGSLHELYVLYQRQFVSDDDLVRRHGTDRWIPAGLMPELRGSRDLVKDRSTPVYTAVLGAFVITLGVILFRSKTIGLMGLLKGAVAAFVVVGGLAYYFRRKSREISEKRTLAWSKPGAAVSANSATGNSHGQSTEER